MLNTPHIAELVKRGDVIGIKEAITAAASDGVQLRCRRCTSSTRTSGHRRRITLEEALAATPTRAATSRPRSISARIVSRGPSNQ
jgi:Tfp pilus assembly ATPase PilU